MARWPGAGCCFGVSNTIRTGAGWQPGLPAVVELAAEPALDGRTGGVVRASALSDVCGWRLATDWRTRLAVFPGRAGRGAVAVNDGGDAGVFVAADDPPSPRLRRT